jgi:hypothetical protein
MSKPAGTVAARAAKNQALYREVNERVKELNQAFDSLYPVGEWVCECANPGCVETIELTQEEYEAVRAGGEGTRFFVKPDEAHVVPEAEDVVERHERYWVVQKFGIAGELVQRSDPRTTSATASQ